MGNTVLDYLWVSIYHPIVFMGVWTNQKAYERWVMTEKDNTLVKLCMN